MRRSKTIDWGPGLVNTAVNGAIERGSREGLAEGDTSAEGFIDIIAAGAREAAEELGVNVGVSRDRVVARALLLNTEDAPTDAVVPYVLLEARSPRTFDQITRSHFADASRHEGWFEVGSAIIGIPSDPTCTDDAIAFLRKFDEEGEIRAAALATTLIALAQNAGGDSLVNSWEKWKGRRPRRGAIVSQSLND